MRAANRAAAPPPVTPRLVIFGVVATTVWSLAHWQIGKRLARGHSPWTKRLIWGGLAVGFVASLIALTGQRAAGPLPRGLTWPGYLYMGFFFLLWITTALEALTRLILKRVSKNTGRDTEAPPNVDRRTFLGTKLGLVMAPGAITGWGLREALREPAVVEVKVPIADLPPGLTGYRIAQVSDIHIGPSLKADFLRVVVDRVNALQADMVAVTGDVIDGYVRDLSDQVAALADLQSRDGVYFCTGNHEYYWDANAWVNEFTRLGLVPLMNEHRLIERANAKLLVAGCTDLHAADFVPEHASNPSGAKANAPAHDLSILLAHQPRSIYDAAAAGFDLQLSGHTHGGQFFPVNFVVHLVQPYVEGLAKHDHTWIYVNRGTGWWGPPLRAAVPAEITLLELIRG